jgi:hypothetical protein
VNRRLFSVHRGRVIATAAALVAAATAAAVITSGSHHRAARSPAQASRPVPTRPGTGGTGRNQPPGAPTPAETPIQRQIDSELAAEESAAAIAAAGSVDPPPPAASAAFPRVPAAARSDTYSYATAFVAELLDIDFAHQTRAALLAWAQSEEAPNSLPGVPAMVADKALYASLALPTPAGSSSPVTSIAGWAAYAAAGVTQRVSGIAVETAPDWTALVARGWQPVDPLMSMVVVTGTITTSRPGRPASPEPFSLALTVGSAARQPGYGAVAVDDWQQGGQTDQGGQG